MTNVLRRRARRQTREAYLAWACAILLILAGVGVMSMGGTQAKSVAAAKPVASPVAPAEPQTAASGDRPVRVIAIKGAPPAPVIKTR